MVTPSALYGIDIRIVTHVTHAGARRGALAALVGGDAAAAGSATASATTKRSAEAEAGGILPKQQR